MTTRLLKACVTCGKPTPRPIDPLKERWPWDKQETWCYASATYVAGIFCSFDHRQDWVEQQDPSATIIRVPHGVTYTYA